MTDRKDLDRVPVFKLGARYFNELLDTPNSYGGFGGYSVVVKQTEDGLEFVQISAFDPLTDQEIHGDWNHVGYLKRDGVDVSVEGHTHGIGDITEFAIGSTGTTITFSSPTIFGSTTSPETGNITDDLDEAKLGIVQKIYHNNSTEPNFSAGWVKLGSGTYATDSLNIIYCEWVGGTRVEYWVTQ